MNKFYDNFLFSREIVIKNDIIYSFLRTDGCVNTTNEVNFIEQVEFVLKITCSNRGGLEIIITSPGGTRSVLLSVCHVLIIFILQI